MPRNSKSSRWIAPLTLACIVFIGVGSPQVVASQEPQRRALLIGINDYTSPKVPDLRGAVNDVEMMKRVLITRLGFPEENIKLLTDKQATRSAVLDAIDELVSTAKKDDVVYFHYSGHGSRARDANGDENDGFDETILPQDARMPGIPDILDDEFEAMFARLKSEHALLVFDSCHSGTITRSVSAVRPRSVPADTRDELYAARPSTRAVVEVQKLNHVLMTGAPPEAEALDGPIDEGFYGLFTYSLSRALDQVGPTGTPKQIHAAVKQELQRIHEQLYFSPPEPQLEGAPERFDEPVMPGQRSSSQPIQSTAPVADAGETTAHAPAELAGPATTTATDTPGGPARRAWLEVAPNGKNKFKLLDGVSLNARPGSRWGIYGQGETQFAPGKALALATVESIKGRDALLAIDLHQGTIPRGARAIEFAPPDISGDMPVLLSGVRAKRAKTLSGIIRNNLPQVRFVKEGEFARILVQLEGGQWQLHDASGLQNIQSIPDSSTEAVAEALVKVLKRASRALALLALENPASDIQLAIGVTTEKTPGTSGRGLVKVTENSLPTYRIRQSGEPRSHGNSLMIDVRADRPVYLTIVDVDTEGTVTQLFPNSYQNADFYPEGYLPANSVAKIPDSLENGNQAGFHWDYSPPSGRDTLRVFASQDIETARLIREFIAKKNESTDSLAQLGEELAVVNTRGIKVVADTPPEPASAAGESMPSTLEQTFKQANWTARSLVLQIDD